MLGLSLFSGIGGLDIAFESAGGTIKAFCENEPFCQRVLSKHWPNLPIYGDIRNLSGEEVGYVDIIYGGAPCQPVSLASNAKTYKGRQGSNDERWLWGEFSRLVRELRPNYVIGENVPGLVSKGLDEICSDLEGQGYAVTVFDYEALAVGARHRRERIFIVAHSRHRTEGMSVIGSSQREGEERTTSYSTVSDTAKRFHRSSEPDFLRVADGLPGGVDQCGGVHPTCYGVSENSSRIKALGNAVVPQQAFPIFKAVIEDDLFCQGR